MSDLVFIAFPTEQKAEEVRQKVLSLQREYLIELGDAVVVVKDDKGHVKLNQMINLTATGAASGALWGTLIGFIFMAPLLGTALGAASGALGGKLLLTLRLGGIAPIAIDRAAQGRRERMESARYALPRIA